MALIRFPEWLKDLPDYDNPGINNAVNLVPKTAGSYGPWRQPVALSTNQMDAQCQGAVSGADYAGNLFAFTGDVGKLYRYTGTTFADVSKVGGYTSVGGYTDLLGRAWHFRQFGTAMLGTNFADPPQKFVLGTDSAFDDMAKNTAPMAKYMGIVQNHLVLANTDDAFDGHVALRIWMSPIGNPLDDDWGNTDKQSDFRTLPTGEEITGIVGGEFGVIFCRRSVYRMTYAGPPVIYQIDEITPQHGCTIPGSLAYNENRIFYHAEDGFQTMVGGGASVPIGQDKVDDFFTKDVDQSRLDRCVSAIDEERKLYILAYPTSTSVDGTPNRMMIYNYHLNRWGLAEEEADMIQSLSSPAMTLEDVAALYPNLNDVPGMTDNPAWQGGAEFLAAVMPDRNLHNFSGENRGFTVDTQEKMLVEGSKAVLRKARPVTDSPDITLAVGVRDFQNGTAPTFTDPATPNSVTGLCSFKKGAKGRYHRIRMVGADGWSGEEVAGIDDLRFVPAGRR